MYNALVAKIESVREIPGCDNIHIAEVNNYQVITSKENQTGDLGIFFECDGQLSEEFCSANDLVRRKNEDGAPAGGMFEQNRRVKSIKLRGARSDGFWTPLKAFEYTKADLSKLKEGDQFEELNGHKICNKYYTPKTLRAMQGNRQARKKLLMFAEHIDTGQFKRERHLIVPGSIVYISEKLHGTSHRIGHVLDEVPITTNKFINQIKKWLKKDITKPQWVIVHGSRRVVLSEAKKKTGFYGEDNFREIATKGIIPRKGEVIYGEIVGYTENRAPIMNPQSTVNLKDKDFSRIWGKEIIYKYGQIEGTCKFYIYRITQVNEDGFVIDLSWGQMTKRARELGVPMVPLLRTIRVDRVPITEQEHPNQVEKAVDQATEVDAKDPQALSSMLDPNTLREGVVVRYETPDGEIGWLKNKSFYFGVLEGYLKESDDYVDTEEAS